MTVAASGFDSARREELADAVVARPPVDVSLVVETGVERDERLMRTVAPVAEEAVERLLPGRRMELSGLREHAVEVEQAGPDAGRQAELSAGRESLSVAALAVSCAVLMFSTRECRASTLEALHELDPALDRPPDRARLRDLVSRASCCLVEFGRELDVDVESAGCALVVIVDGNGHLAEIPFLGARVDG